MFQKSRETWAFLLRFSLKLAWHFCVYYYFYYFNISRPDLTHLGCCRLPDNNCYRPGLRCFGRQQHAIRREVCSYPKYYSRCWTPTPREESQWHPHEICKLTYFATETHSRRRERRQRIVLSKMTVGKRRKRDDGRGHHRLPALLII